MVELSGRSAGVSTREIDLTGPRRAAPVGTPAGVIGVASKGPAFVPLTFASLTDFVATFGAATSHTFQTLMGPIAVAEWLRNASAATFVRVLGAGDGNRRSTTGANAGNVTNAGFVVGQQLPLDTGFLGANPYANAGGPLGRMHFLGCYMSESAGSTIFASASIQLSSSAVPIIRAVIMAPSGVVPMLSHLPDVSGTLNRLSASGSVATAAGPHGAITGNLDLSGGAQTFVLLLNGHIGTDTNYPNMISASFDMTSANYFGIKLNTDPLKIQQAGHYLYARYDVQPTAAVVTGTHVFAINTTNQPLAFITTGSAARNAGSSTAPSYENWEDRFTTPASPSIISQKFGGLYQNLFRVWSLSDGFQATKYKISIENIAKSTVNDASYGTFDLVVRDLLDNDEDQIVLESFRGLTLDPNSDNYIARRIGDTYAYYDFDKTTGGQKIVVTGKYPNNSTLIRVAMADAVDNGTIDPTALPIGFRGPHHLVTSGSDCITAINTDQYWYNLSENPAGITGSIKRAVEPPIPFREHIAVGTSPKKSANTKLYWGMQFEQKPTLADPNSSNKLDESFRHAYVKHFPRHQVSNVNVSVGENAGTADAAGTILDSDRFNNNLFALDRIRIRTGSDGQIDTKEIVSMSYVRNGVITADDSLPSASPTGKTRALSVATDFGNLTVRSLNKFSFFLQGGFDGLNVFNSNTANMTNTAIVQEMADSNRGQANGPTVGAFKKALSIMGDVTDVDIKLLAIPGIRDAVITDRAISTIESDRFDALYIMDPVEYDTMNIVVTSSLQNISVANTATAHSLRGLNSNFAATYFPNVTIKDPFNGLSVEVPPSVAVLGAFALNDRLSYPWFAPAGFTRGSLQNAEQASVRLSRQNMDTLQDAKINPIVSFPGSQGVVVWGQKTLQAAASALDRVNVRRLLIEIRREVREIARSFLFEPNRDATLQKFSGIVTPLLQRIQEQQGINRFKVKIDATTTTQADVENNIVRGKIYLEPTRTAEVVSVDFVLTNLGQLESA